ncbi:unnamed protein product, partial [Mesorhabditis belari]|uniref:C-type lectin domain-containing protein n=1 Tax=Mesorhabditis belari TaxID=2138241 RepID=A0AAF3EBC3_9BILA
MWYFFLLAFLLKASDATFSCPNGTLQLGNEHRCIFIETSALIQQDVSTFVHGAPPEKRCQYSNAWIGLYADGQVGNGPWSDGTPVNYTNSQSTASASSPWMTLNKECETQPHAWKYYGLEAHSARFVCKQASKSRLIREKLIGTFMRKSLYLKGN